MSHLGGNKCNLFVRIKNEIAATEVTLPVGEKFEAKKSALRRWEMKQRNENTRETNLPSP